MGYYATRVRSYTEVLGVLANYATDNPIVSRTNKYDPESGHTFTGTGAGEIFVYVTGAATVGFYRLTCTTAGANGTAVYTLARATTISGTYTNLQTGVASGSRVTITSQNLDVYIDLTTNAVVNDTITFQLIANNLSANQDWTQTRRNTTNDDLVLSKTINSEVVYLSFESDALSSNGHLRLTSFDTYNSANSLYAQTNNCPSVYVPLKSTPITMYIFITVRSIKVSFDMGDSVQHMYMGLISTYGSSSQIPIPVCVGGMTSDDDETHTSSSADYGSYWRQPISSFSGTDFGAYIRNPAGVWTQVLVSRDRYNIFPFSSQGGNTYRTRYFSSIAPISPIRIEPIIYFWTLTGSYILGTFEGVYIYNSDSQSSGDNTGDLILFNNHNLTTIADYALFDTSL